MYSLPRSRTFWLSQFLSASGWHCGHDELRHARAMEDITAWLKQPQTGSAETLAAPFWRLTQNLCPDIKTVVVRRPVVEVVESLMALGLPFDRSILTRNMTKLDRKLDQIEDRVPGVLSVKFTDLADEATCARLFTHCLSLDHQPERWALFNAANLQTSMLATLRYANAYAPQLDRLGKMAKQKILAAMTRPVPDVEGITFQQETFDQWYSDAKDLIADHLVQVGEAPDNHANKNVEMMRRVDAVGGMQITTARSNGRMFGYLMTIMGPSFENTTDTEALNLTFYASPLVRGLGIKLQRASNEALRQKGVSYVFLRAGVRGTGPKMGALYRRIGGEGIGEMFRLDLKAA